MSNNKNKKRSEVSKTDKFIVFDESNTIQKVIFPHTVKVGLLDNSTYSATISGSIHHTHEGKSFLVAGSNTTITSASNDWIITATESIVCWPFFGKFSMFHVITSNEFDPPKVTLERFWASTKLKEIIRTKINLNILKDIFS